jgi:hypothetical protein
VGFLCDVQEVTSRRMGGRAAGWRTLPSPVVWGEWWVAVCGEGRGRDESARLQRNDSGDVWWRT